MHGGAGRVVEGMLEGAFAYGGGADDECAVGDGLRDAAEMSLLRRAQPDASTAERAVSKGTA